MPRDQRPGHSSDVGVRMEHHRDRDDWHGRGVGRFVRLALLGLGGGGGNDGPRTDLAARQIGVQLVNGLDRIDSKQRQPAGLDDARGLLAAFERREPSMVPQRREKTQPARGQRLALGLRHRPGELHDDVPCLGSRGQTADRGLEFGPTHRQRPGGGAAAPLHVGASRKSGGEQQRRDG